MLRVWIGACILALSGCTVGGNLRPIVIEGEQYAELSAVQGDFLLTVNQNRLRNSVPAVVRDTRVDRTALAHASDMSTVGFLSHRGSSGSNVLQRVKMTGYDACFAAENIANTWPSEAAVLAAWLGSAGHRANILNPKARAFGLAQDGDNWVMVLAAPCR